MPSVPPGLVLILGAIPVPLLRGRLRQAWLVALPVAALALALALPDDFRLRLDFMGLALEPVRVDRLSWIVGLLFHVALLLGILYSLHVRDALQHAAALSYAGAAIGAVYAGDLVTLFAAWEITAVASSLLVFAARRPESNEIGLRYLVWQIGSGVLLLAGIVVHWRATGSVAFGALDAGTTGGLLILLGFGVKAAFPFLHGWLVEAYPASTPAGTVFLSAFTTKMAVVALARGFAGTPELVLAGGAMAVLGAALAIVQDDARRALSYALVNQLGFMVMAVGMGSAMAVNGAVALACAHVLYKALLFMAVGVAMERTGTARLSQLGGLARSMPWTAAMAVVAGVSSLPGLLAFVGKGMIVGEAAARHTAAWWVLIVTAVGVFVVTALKVPAGCFFGAARGAPATEATWNQRAAMGLTAALLLALAVPPGLGWLLGRLPQRVPDDWHAYSVAHVLSTIQLLGVAALAWGWLTWKGWWPAAPAREMGEVDGLVRWGARALWHRTAQPAIEGMGRVWAWLGRQTGFALFGTADADGGGGRVPRQLSIATAVLVTVLALLGFLLAELWLRG